MNSDPVSTTPSPWLSVVLPTHNGERWIAAAMDSLACQADPGIEVLVIDTSDRDATLEIVRKYSDRLSLRLFQPKDVTGCSAKTNYGVRQARAKHISWLCQDDLWLPDRS